MIVCTSVKTPLVGTPVLATSTSNSPPITERVNVSTTNPQHFFDPIFFGKNDHIFPCGPCSRTFSHVSIAAVSKCAGGLGACAQVCYVADGDERCSCKHGYKLLGDGKTCEGMRNIAFLQLRRS